MRFQPAGRARLAVFVVLVLGVALGGIAYGSIPDATGIIHGCYAKRDGALRVVDSDTGATCNTTKETALEWGQTGPPGPAGSQGAQGPSGTAGQAGGTVYGTAQLLLSDANYVEIPGLSMTADVPENAKVLVSTDGLMISPGQDDGAELALFVDGQQYRGSFNRFVICIGASTCPWATSHVLSLAPGSHTFSVRIALRQSGQSDNGLVSFGNGFGSQGTLSVVILKT